MSRKSKKVSVAGMSWGWGVSKGQVTQRLVSDNDEVCRFFDEYIGKLLKDCEQGCNVIWYVF